MKHLLPILALAAAFSVSAQSDYNWMPLKSVAIPDSLQSEDAIYLENITTIDLRQYYESSITQFKRIRINTKYGAETFSSREIYQFDGGKISMRNARIIKPNGMITKVGDDQIIETRSERKLKFETKHSKRIQMVFPGLEAGDVVDIVYQLDSEDPIFSGSFLLEDDLPSLHSRFTLRNSSGRKITTYYDEHGSQFSKTDGSAPTLTWDKSNVRKLVTGTFGADPPTATVITFTMTNPTYPMSYDDIYGYDYSNFSCAAGVGSVTADLAANGVKFGEKEGLDTKISGLIGYFEKTGFKWIPENEISPKVKTFDYFERHVINESLFFRYVQVFCKEQKIRYEIGYSQSLLSGRFDPTIVLAHQMRNRFLHLIDSTGSPHYLFGPVDAQDFYYLDEIPNYIEGNACIILQGDGSSLQEVVGKNVPSSTARENRHVVAVTFREDGETMKVKRTDNAGGHFSNLLRDSTDGWLKTLKISDLPIAPNDRKKQYPYEVTYVQDTVRAVEQFVSRIDDSLIWFNPSAFIPEYLFYSDESVADMGEYIILPFQLSKKYTFVYNAAKPVKLAEDLKRFNLDNNVGMVKAGAMQLTEKSVKFMFEIELKKRFITSETDKEELSRFLGTLKSLQAKKWVLSES